MANDSLIRKIPLEGNVDLTNFHADIHDYEGFDNDNSLFLNKRKVNWWKQNTGVGEVGGGVSAVVDGDYFRISKSDVFIGKIKRDYYKLESVSATDYLSESLEKVVNPYPATTLHNYYVVGKDFYPVNAYSVARISNGFTFVSENNNCKIFVYDENNNLYDTFTWPSYKNDERLHASYTGVERNFVNRLDGNTDFPILTCDLHINIGASEVLLYAGSFAGVYNIPEKRLREDFMYGVIGGTQKSENVFFSSSYMMTKSTTNGDCVYTAKIYVLNGQIYSAAYAFNSKYTSSKGNLYINNDRKGMWDIGLNTPIQFSYLSSSSLRNGVYLYSFVCRGAAQVYYSNAVVENNSTYIQFLRNYSIKYGKWTINYIDNVAKNIAHEYKKLFAIKGDEADGVLTDIDGYNDTYIYFHYGSDYYRISIAKTDNFLEVVTNLNNIYYVFNTISYLNAYYSNGNDWFCSCDDWNDRVQWRNNTAYGKEIQCISRLNNDWQIKTDVLSVSDLIVSNLKNISVVADVSKLHPFSSDSTWNGSDFVLNGDGTFVDTTLWTVGDSTAGYYYTDQYISSPISLTPFYLDDNYTCPQYEDQNGNVVLQNYTVYFPHEIPNDTYQTLVKEGIVNKNGFTVHVDETNIFENPSSSSQIQNVPCLLDTVFLSYTTSIILKNNEGTYLGMISSSLGGQWVLIYLYQTEIDPLKKGDAVFVINGVEFSYRAESNRLLDYTGRWVCNTYMMKYLGFSTKVAYFYCYFDRAVYIFEGDNSLKKLIPMEKYKPQSKVYDSTIVLDTLNITSLDVVFVNLDTAMLILYENQYVILNTGKINSWNIDENTGIIIVNGVKYSIIKSALNDDSENLIECIPIKFDTQFYGDPENEKNIINDCVYLTVDNLMSLPYGSVTIQAIALQNQKVIKAEEKTVNLKQEDFNELSQCLIKYQPKLQECKGFKLKIKSDFEVADLRIGTTQGAINQTTKRI